MTDKFATVIAVLANIEKNDERERERLRSIIRHLGEDMEEIQRLSRDGESHTLKLININAKQALERWRDSE